MSVPLRAVVIGMLVVLASTGATRAVDTAEHQQAHTEWLGYNGGYDATRFSPRTQIDMQNVASLTEVGRLKIPETRSFQSGPVVIGDTMYVTTVKATYAIDARTGEHAGCARLSRRRRCSAHLCVA